MPEPPSLAKLLAPGHPALQYASLLNDPPARYALGHTGEIDELASALAGNTLHFTARMEMNYATLKTNPAIVAFLKEHPGIQVLRNDLTDLKHFCTLAEAQHCLVA
jgi:hypothetical protein